MVTSFIAFEYGGVVTKFGLQLQVNVGTESGTTFNSLFGSIIVPGLQKIVWTESGTKFGSDTQCIVRLILVGTESRMTFSSTLEVVNFQL